MTAKSLEVRAVREKAWLVRQAACEEVWIKQDGGFRLSASERHVLGYGGVPESELEKPMPGPTERPHRSILT